MINRKAIGISMIGALLLATTAAFAQQSFTLRGMILKKNYSERIAQVVITNMHNKSMMMSDELGNFSIVATKGDTLEFSKKDYAPQSYVVLSNADAIIYMEPAIELQQVDVRAKSRRQEVNETLQDYRAKGIYGSENGYLPVWSFLNSPLTGLYQIFGKDARNYRRFLAFSKKESESIEVSRRYNAELVKRITNMSDEDVTKFMQVYTPSYEDMKEWNDYQVILYIKRNYAFYTRHHNDIKLPALVTPKVEDN